MLFSGFVLGLGFLGVVFLHMMFKQRIAVAKMLWGKKKRHKVPHKTKQKKPYNI